MTRATCGRGRSRAGSETQFVQCARNLGACPRPPKRRIEPNCRAARRLRFLLRTAPGADALEVTVGKAWSLSEELVRRGVTRRDFVAFCAGVAAYFSLPEGGAARRSPRRSTRPLKPSLIWLEFQDCAGNTESLLRASRPTVAEVILDAVSVDYHETIMAAAGKRAGGGARSTRRSTIRRTSTSSSSRARSRRAPAASTAPSAARARCRSRSEVCEHAAGGHRGRHVRGVRRAPGGRAEPHASRSASRRPSRTSRTSSTSRRAR